jgi:hypothetical protein
MIDDQSGYCAGAEEARVRAIHFARGSQSPRSQFQTVLSLYDVIPLL